MRASGDKVARPFQEVGMVLQKFYRGQRHFRSSTSKFVENPRKGRKFSTQRICTGRWCKCVAKLHHQCGKPKIFRVLNVWPTNLLIDSLICLTTILTRGNEINSLILPRKSYFKGTFWYLQWRAAQPQTIMLRLGSWYISGRVKLTSSLFPKITCSSGCYAFLVHQDHTYFVTCTPRLQNSITTSTGNQSRSITATW